MLSGVLLKSFYEADLKMKSASADDKNIQNIKKIAGESF